MNAPLPKPTDPAERIEAALAELLQVDDEPADARWDAAMEQVREYVLRPGKRVRPALVVTGWSLVRPGEPVPSGVYEFAASLELLHAFMLVHDDVADRAETRRGGKALHHLLGSPGESLAVVAGDHLFARAIEGMLSCGLARAADATRYMLAVSRHTAIGQFLDLQLAETPVEEVTLFQTLRVAHLKTARYGFVAPLVCGAMLGGADEAVLDAVSRVGRHTGLAFQLRDDLLGLFGDPAVTGKSGVADYLEGKRTFPLVAAFTRAHANGRAHLASLWTRAPKTEQDCREARAALELYGGRRATERAIERSEKAAQKALESLPATPARTVLAAMLHKLSRRAA